MNTTYKEAGVNKEAGYNTVDKIKRDAKATYNASVLNGIGDFAALYELGKYQHPVLVSGTDGVGTKIMLAKQFDLWDDIGTDCFAMCANDILCHGAKPLFFLDYLACGKLDPSTAARIVKSIATACLATQTALVGGETAEMPGMYQVGDYDVAGFCVGVVEKSHIINGKKNIGAGDVVIGLASSGLHSNGFSLIRHIVKDYQHMLSGKPLIEHLMRPTKLYINPILQLIEKHPHIIKGIAHITGGGLIENVPRIIPAELCAHIQTRSVPSMPIYDFVRSLNIKEEELWATFNMGVGLVLIVKEQDTEITLRFLSQMGESAFELGTIKNKEHTQNILLHF